jgi:hypothetical protein
VRSVYGRSVIFALRAGYDKIAAMPENKKRFWMMISFAVVGGTMAFLLFGNAGFFYVSAFVAAMSFVVLH